MDLPFMSEEKEIAILYKFIENIVKKNQKQGMTDREFRIDIASEASMLLYYEKKEDKK